MVKFGFVIKGTINAGDEIDAKGYLRDTVDFIESSIQAFNTPLNSIERSKVMVLEMDE